MAIERLLTGSIRERVQDLMSTEDLIIESFKDIVKDELKHTFETRSKKTRICMLKSKKRLLTTSIKRHVPFMLN